jgi:PPM family protein phosphatase
MSHKVRHAHLTDVGIRRSHNQDACSAQPASDDKQFRAVGHVFVVADGMGGHAVGEKASAKAVRDIPLTFTKHVGTEGPEAAIRRAFSEANAGIYQIGTANPEFKGLGTTGVCLFLRPEGAWIGHVGDSRVYRIRENKVDQLTFDHSWVWEMARRQGIDPDELGDFKRNVIIRSLGPEADVEIDVEGPHAVEPGDTFLMCSDGLTNHVKTDEIGAVVSAFPPQEACAILVELANLRGGSDNITCLIAQIPRNDGTSSPEGQPVKRGGLKEFLKWWEAKVTWPLTMLALGAGLVGLSIYMKVSDFGGFIFTFCLATILTIAGLGGLALKLRKTSVTGSVAEGAGGRDLNVYKSYPYAIDQAMCQRIDMQERQATEELKRRELPIDETAHDKLVATATAKLQASEWLAAFRARCQALRLVASVLNKNQQKDEEFKPNWTTPQRA